MRGIRCAAYWNNGFSHDGYPQYEDEHCHQPNDEHVNEEGLRGLVGRCTQGWLERLVLEVALVGMSLPPISGEVVKVVY